MGILIIQTETGTRAMKSFKKFSKSAVEASARTSFGRFAYLKGQKILSVTYLEGK
jgi:hypothetical protein